MTDADFVKDARKQLDMTQATFARSLGVTDRQVQKWEAGTVGLTVSRRRHIELLLREKRKR